MRILHVVFDSNLPSGMVSHLLQKISDQVPSDQVKFYNSDKPDLWKEFSTRFGNTKVPAVALTEVIGATGIETFKWLKSIALDSEGYKFVDNFINTDFPIVIPPPPPPPPPAEEKKSNSTMWLVAGGVLLALFLFNKK